MEEKQDSYETAVDGTVGLAVVSADVLHHCSLLAWVLNKRHLLFPSLGILLPCGSLPTHEWAVQGPGGLGWEP